MTEEISRRFLTIRQTAKLGLLSEYQLRLWQKQGKLPGVYSGAKFMVNVPQLESKLEKLSTRGGVEIDEKNKNLYP